jgi:penicillin-binding protein 2
MRAWGNGWVKKCGMAVAMAVFAAHVYAAKPVRRHAASKPVSTPAHHAAASSHGRASLHLASRSMHGRRHGAAVHHSAVHHDVERFTASSFNPDVTLGDNAAGEDPVVRAAAIAALNGMNGTALAIDPATGRILAMVNQKLALSAGAEPCSTIKLSVALAGLEEGIIHENTPVNLGGHYAVTLTEALAHSNNLYFETVGRALGFERVKHYANEFGLGEIAGWDIPGEQLGVYPDQVLPERLGGVGRMCSFGESVQMTPLQLGAMVAAIANGGTLFYLQHPTSPEEVAAFTPKVKRQLNIAPILPEMVDGMRAAVTYGTARSLKTNFTAFPVFGKTGTCSNNGTRFGWFASYSDTPRGRIVTVIFLEGGRPVFGPKAAELTGDFYRGMYDHNFFGPQTVQQPALTPTNTGTQPDATGEAGTGAGR